MPPFPASGGAGRGDAPGAPAVSVRRATTRSRADRLIRSLDIPRTCGTARARRPVRSATTGVYRVRPATRSQVLPRRAPRSSEAAPAAAPAWHRRAAPRPPASVSGRMSIRHPVSLAARRAFCPSLPIASYSW